MIRESGDIRAALEHLEQHQTEIRDPVQLLELRGQYHLILDQLPAAARIYTQLVDRNPNQVGYLDHLFTARQLAKAEDRVKLLRELQVRQPT